MVLCTFIDSLIPTDNVVYIIVFGYPRDLIVAVTTVYLVQLLITSKLLPNKAAMLSYSNDIEIYNIIYNL